MQAPATVFVPSTHLRLVPKTPAPPSSRVPSFVPPGEDPWAWIFHLERLGQAGLMAGGLAHDTRNLLAGISGICQLALEHPDGAMQRDALQRAHELALQAAEAMRVFVTFVKSAGGAPASCRVDEVVRDALRFLKPAITGTRVEVVPKIAGDAVVRFERTLLLQAIVNLVLNAIKAIGTSPGRIQIGCRTEGDEVILEVEDDGPGIPPHVLGRLFQPFTTGQPGSEGGAVGGGTGLGLFVTRRMVEEQGGCIDVRTEPGKGTTFRLALRAAAAAAKAESKEATQGGGR